VSKVKNTLISAMAIGLLAGSTVGAMAQTEEPSTGSAGCQGPLVEPGVYDGINELSIDARDVVQPYRVVVPQGYAERAPVPLILFPASGSGDLDYSFGWWSPYLDPAESIFVVAEQSRSWQRLTTTLTALLDRLEEAYCIDPRRVHAMGSSSSTITVLKLACEASDRIASYSVVMAGFSPLFCAPERAVPLMAMTGDTDRWTVSQSVEEWAEAYECDGDPVIEDLGSGVTRTAHQGCLADIVLYDVEGAGHVFFHPECLGDESEPCYPNEVLDQLREMERFFAEHPLPAE
jgi:poly(3-hydroxybutyrate) depolymerase